MDLTVTANGMLRLGHRFYRCALGRGGIRRQKAEGDGATPVGRFLMRRALYRSDRLDPPQTALEVARIEPDQGWCDAPADPMYNRPVRLPYPASHEKLWRDDRLYDLLVVLGHNDDPPKPGAGSAIFLHVARPDYGPTEGCVALSLPDLLEVLAECGPQDYLRVTPDDTADGRRK